MKTRTKEKTFQDCRHVLCHGILWHWCWCCHSGCDYYHSGCDYCHSGLIIVNLLILIMVTNSEGLLCLEILVSTFLSLGSQSKKLLLSCCDVTKHYKNWIEAIFKGESKIYKNLRKRTASRLERGRNTTIHLLTTSSIMCRAIVNLMQSSMQKNRQCKTIANTKQ